MRVVLTGSRDTGNPEATRQAISKRLAELPRETLIIHGGARGVDLWADAAAWSLGIETFVIRPDWKRHGRKAGILRNRDMLDMEPELVLAFWNGGSSGTLDTITEARKRGIKTEVIPIEPPVA